MKSRRHRALRLSGLAAFLTSLSVTAWWWTARAGLMTEYTGVRAAAMDAVLFGLFAMHHSVFARPWAKRLVEQVVPTDLVRTLYVWVASMLLAAVCALWMPIGGVLFHAQGVTAAVLRLAQVLGLVIGALTIRRTSIGELSGAWDTRLARLEAAGVYRFVRHPLYTSLLLIVLATPTMTGDRAVFAALSLVFILAAMPFEEAGLVRQFGQPYDMYRSAVRWRLIPYIH